MEKDQAKCQDYIADIVNIDYQLERAGLKDNNNIKRAEEKILSIGLRSRYLH